MITFHKKSLHILHTTVKEGSIEGVEAFSHLSFPKEAKFSKIVEMNQVHADHLHYVDNINHAGQKIIKTDGLITAIKGMALMIKTADCIPVVLYDQKKEIISALHVGWRGAVAQLAPQAVKKIHEIFESEPKDIFAYIGPSIRQCCYVFESKPMQYEDPAWHPFILTNKNQWSIDLTGFIKQSLLSVGIENENIFDTNECTAHSTKWFSYFRYKQTGNNRGLFATVVQLQ